MHSVYCILLFITYFGLSVYCQGGGGGGGGSSCTTDECRRIGGIIVGSIFGGILGLILCVFCGLHCHWCCAGRPFRKNSTFIHSSNSKQQKHELYESRAFRSGVWSRRYFQYGAWHGPFEFSLSFDSQLMKVTGAGSDDVGTFTVDGVYSLKTRRVALTKRYQLGTGNPSENLGHQVIIQLAWNGQSDQFEGKWYVQTSKYHGEDKFELKFKE